MNIFKILVVSDTHGNAYALKKLISAYQNKINLFLHLGDGEAEFFQMQNMFSNLKMIMVCGNCDLNLNNKLPKLKLLHIDGYNIIACHGHEFSVKQNLHYLQQTAKNLKANLALFGHTHIRHIQTDENENLTLFNPGSLSIPRTQKPSFGLITIKNKKIDAKIIDFL